MRSAFKHIYVCERVGGGEFTFGVGTYKASVERVAFRLNLKEGRRGMAFHPGSLHPQPGRVLKHVVCI